MFDRIVLKARIVEMIQVGPPKNPTNNFKTLTKVLTIYGLYTERKLGVMTKLG